MLRLGKKNIVSSRYRTTHKEGFTPSHTVSQKFTLSTATKLFSSVTHLLLELFVIFLILCD